MKRLSILSKVLVLFICFSVMVFAYNAGSVVNGKLYIPNVEFDPGVDGILDAEWEFPNVGMFVYIFESANSFHGYSDFASLYRAAWNADGFYFFGSVVDDSIYTGNSGSHNNDCFEIYFDGDNSKGGSYDGVDDVQWRWVYGTYTGEPGGGQPACPNAVCEWVKTAEGYDFELSIPTSDLTFTPAESKVIGWEVQVADNDTGPRESMTKWWSESNNSWQQPVLFGTAELVLVSSGIAEPVAANISLSVPSVISSSASISYTIPARSSVRLTLFNLAGQAVASLVNGVQDAGPQTATLDASGLASGVYLCRLEACGSAAAKKVMLIK